MERRAAYGAFITGLAAVTLLGSLHLAGAQGSSQVKVQPALFEERVNPGDQFNSSVKVTNPDPVAKEFTISIEDISDINGAGEPVFATSVPEFGVSGWVTLGATKISLPPHGVKDVPFAINVPKTATPGGHYGAVFVSYGAQRPNENGAGIGYQVGSLIDLRVAGDAKEIASVSEFSADKGLYQSPQVTFTAKVHNDGNVLLRPRGPIDIMNMFGQKVDTVVMNDNNEAIFPGTGRTFAASWSGSGLTIGRFDAVMSLTYGNETKKTISETTSFWVIPLVPIVAVLGSIVFFMFLFIWSVKAYVRKKISDMNAGGRQRAALSNEEKFLYQSRLPFSRLAFIVVATVIFAILFLIVLFFLFG